MESTLWSHVSFWRFIVFSVPYFSEIHMFFFYRSVYVFFDIHMFFSTILFFFENPYVFFSEIHMFFTIHMSFGNLYFFFDIHMSFSTIHYVFFQDLCNLMHDSAVIGVAEQSRSLSLFSAPHPCAAQVSWSCNDNDEKISSYLSVTLTL